MEIQANSVGHVFTARIMRNGRVVNVADAVKKSIVFEKPDGTGFERQASLATNGVDGLIEYALVEGDVAVAGEWSVQGFVELIPDARDWSQVQPFTVNSNVTYTAANRRPMMSIIPGTPSLPTAETFAAAWAEAQAMVGRRRVVTNYDGVNWLDIYHQDAIALFTTERLFIQISRSVIEGMTREEFLGFVAALLALYSDKIWAINLAIECEELLADVDATLRETISLADDLIHDHNPDIITCCSVVVQVCLNEDNVETVVANCEAIVDAVAISDLPSPDLIEGVDIEDIVPARYAPFITAADPDTLFIWAEFSYSSGEDSSAIHGEVVQEVAVQRAWECAEATGRFLLFNVDFLYNPNEWIPAYSDHGLREGPITTGHKKLAWHKWVELAALFNG